MLVVLSGIIFSLNLALSKYFRWKFLAHYEITAGMKKTLPICILVFFPYNSHQAASFCCSVAQLCLTLCNPMDYIACQASCPSLSPRVCSNSCPLSQWCHPTVSSSVTPLASCPQSFPESGSFPVSQLFASGDQSTVALASASVIPMSIQSWFPLGLTGFISLMSKGLSRVFSSTTIRTHQIFGTQLSLWSSSQVHMQLLGRL